jgi:hypothetical protein
MTAIQNILQRTQQLFSTLFQAWRIDKETESVSRSPKFISILKQARAQKGKGLSSQEMRQWVESEFSED